MGKSAPTPSLDSVRKSRARLNHYHNESECREFFGGEDAACSFANDHNINRGCLQTFASMGRCQSNNCASRSFTRPLCSPRMARFRISLGSSRM